MRIAYARREEMEEISSVHGGAKSILFKSLFGSDDFGTPWRFIHSAILPPAAVSATIGTTPPKRFLSRLTTQPNTHNGCFTESHRGDCRRRSCAIASRGVSRHLQPHR